VFGGDVVHCVDGGEPAPSPAEERQTSTAAITALTADWLIIGRMSSADQWGASVAPVGQ
jgi:hypothetical protein